MPVYVLFRGDCSNLAYEQPGKPPFVAVDAEGREWLCVETDQAEIGDGFPDAAGEMLVAQRAAYLQGLSKEGSQVRLMKCPDEATVRRQLIEDSGPPVADLQQRLAIAGWTLVGFTFGTDQPFRLTLGRGETTYTVEAPGEREAWRRAAQENVTMEIAIHDSPTPLRRDEDGAVRVGETRVPIDVVVLEFLKGEAPEAIVSAYPALQLPDVYAVIAYYLRNMGEVNGYILARTAAADQLRREIESRQPDRQELRAKLLARKAQREVEHASSGK